MRQPFGAIWFWLLTPACILIVVVTVASKASVESATLPPLCNSNIIEIAARGRIIWQKNKQYGRRKFSELGVQLYQRILGNAMHAMVIVNQKQEAMIGCGVINKMTSLGMPVSYRSA